MKQAIFYFRRFQAQNRLIKFRSIAIFNFRGQSRVPIYKFDQQNSCLLLRRNNSSSLSKFIMFTFHFSAINPPIGSAINDFVILQTMSVCSYPVLSASSPQVHQNTRLGVQCLVSRCVVALAPLSLAHILLQLVMLTFGSGYVISPYLYIHIIIYTCIYCLSRSLLQITIK